MWHKRHRDVDEGAPAGKRLRDNLVDLYGSGQVPGERAQSLLEDAGAFAREVGRPDMQDLRRHRSPGSVGNVARDLRQRLLKRSQWPPLYQQHIRFLDPGTQNIVAKPLCFLLPHEVVSRLALVGDTGVLFSTAGLDETNLKKHRSITQTLQEPFVSLSLWGDGVPYSWNRKKSVDLWTLSLPGLPHPQQRDIRIGLTGIPHEYVCKETHDDVLAVFAWSFRTLLHGFFPTGRADGQPWTDSDTWRKKRAGEAIPKAILMEIKGDWKQMEACFKVPGWLGGLAKPVCWRCTSTKLELRTEAGPGASWLLPESRLSHYQCLQRILDNGGELCPIWSVPFFTTEGLRLDWLHIADQGITPVFLGGLFDLFLVDKTFGRNRELRCERLWRAIRAFYIRTGTVDRLNRLTTTMVKPKKGSIELCGSGAEVRALVPFGLELVNTWAQNELDVERLGAKVCMQKLSACYAWLSPEESGAHHMGSLLENALAFHQNLQALHALSSKRWQLRPKLHLFLELSAEGATPSSSWNYREESFGGSLGRQAHVAGGVTGPLSMSRSMLTKFCCKESLPKLVPQMA